MIRQRILAAAGLAAILGGCYFRGAGYVGSEPEPTRTPLATITAVVTPAATATLQPITNQPITNQPIRIQFDIGTYGETITGTTSTKYLLWAAQGQVFTTTLTSQQSALASLYGPGDKPLYEEMAAGNTATAKLPANGDYTLEIRSSGRFTAEVEIR